VNESAAGLAARAAGAAGAAVCRRDAIDVDRPVLLPPPLG
jgi:hypothetical protein